MKKSLAVLTSFVLLFSAVDSISFLPSVHAEAQAPVSEETTTPVTAPDNNNGATNNDTTTTPPAEQPSDPVVDPPTQNTPNEPFFYDVPLPATMNPYIPGDIKNHWASPYLLHFIYSDILKGYKLSNGTYVIKPENNITRAEFVALLVRTLGLTSNQAGKNFVDVPKGTWFYDAIRIASAKGLVSGEDAKHFAPERNIQRDEMAVIIMKAFQNTLTPSTPVKAFKDVPSTWWAKPYIDQAVRTKVISGYTDNTFRPLNPATRAEAVRMLFVGIVGQTNNLPKDEDLINTVINMDKEMLPVLQSLDFTSASQIIGKYSLGYDQVMGNYALSLYQEILNKKTYLLGFEISGEYNGKVLSKSNSMAAVQLSNVTQKILKLKDNTVVDEYTEDINNIVYLRKMPDGQWKIYYNMPDVEKE